MKNMNRLAVAAAVLAFSACGGGAGLRKSSADGSRPVWVEGESPKWSRAQYVTGVGSADDEESAADRARGEISRVFSSNVSVDTTVDESETNVNSGGKTASSFSQQVAQSVRTASKKMLEGVEIVERWKDSAASRYYALATLSKSKAMAAVAEKTQALDADALQWKTKLDAAGDKFERAKAGAKLAALLKGRLDLENDRRVLGGGPLPSTVDVSAAKAAAAKALEALDVVVIATGDHAEEVETGIVTGLVASGLMAKRGNPGDKGDLIVESQSAAQTIEGGDKSWKWSRGTATVTLKDGREDKAFSRFDVSDRQASADAGEARRRAAAGLAKKAAEKVSAAITDFFQNQ
ncbi:MAG: LPP20 family lipoprotein [Elusimicrobia bacterium]|nr:LPP20 family lipoprotein [Elusimicrobiota bacterium]